MRATKAFVLLVMVILVSPAYAQLGSQSFPDVNFSDDVVTAAEVDVAESEFSSPGLLPGHPFYGFKRFVEGVRLFFAFDAEDRAKAHLDIAKARLAEAKALAEANRTEEAEQAVEDFGKEIDAFSGIGANASEIAKESGEALEKSALVLMLVRARLPEAAQRGIDVAINNSLEKKIRVELEAEGETGSSAEVEGRSEELAERIREAVSRRSGGAAGGVICIQVITPARSPAGEVREFPTPCDVPPGWTKLPPEAVEGEAMESGAAVSGETTEESSMTGSAPSSIAPSPVTGYSVASGIVPARIEKVI